MRIRSTLIRSAIGKNHLCLLSALLMLGLAASKTQAQARINLSGIDEALALNLRAHLGFDDEPCDSSERRMRLLVREADGSIREALRALGYYHANWQKELQRDNGCWVFQLDLQPGPPVSIASVNLEVTGAAIEDPLFQAYLRNLPLRQGLQLNHGAYEDMKSDLQSLAQQHGYFDSRFSASQLRVNTDSNTAEIEIGFVSGDRYRFGAIDYQTESFAESFVRRFATFEEDDPYDVDKLVEFQQQLSNSRYFQNVNVQQLQHDNAGKRVPVRVELEPRPKFAYAVGAGFATDTGPRGSLEFNNRRVNQYGHRFRSRLDLSPVISSLTFDYEIPLRDPLREKINLTAGWEQQDTDTSDREAYNIGASITNTLANQWLNTLSLNLQQETYEIAGERRTTSLLMPGIAWRNSRANNFAYPTRGWRLNLSLQGALEDVGSDISLLQLRAGAKYILPLLGGRVLTRADLGGSLLGDFADLPASLRFFAGGDNSVRGYGYEELGPSNENGEVIGGKHLITASVEYDYPVYNNYGLAVFYDIGNAFDTDQFHLSRSAGLGVRWRSPIGPIRVDFAVPLDEDGFRVHLSMGPDI